MKSLIERQALRGAGPDEKEVYALVLALVPEFHLVKVQASDGSQYAITRATQGVQLANLREGQQLRCTVSSGLPRVLAAELVSPTD